MIRGGISCNRLRKPVILSYFAVKSIQKRANASCRGEKVHMPAEKSQKLAKCGTCIKAWDLGGGEAPNLAPH